MPAKKNVKKPLTKPTTPAVVPNPPVSRYGIGEYVIYVNPKTKRRIAGVVDAVEWDPESGCWLMSIAGMDEMEPERDYTPDPNRPGPATKKYGEAIVGATPKQNGGKPEPKRICRRVWKSGNGAFGIVHIVNGEGHDYLYQHVTGWTFLLTKLEPDHVTTYTVSIGEGENPRGCGCDGWKHRDSCKHVEALEALLEAGSL